MDVRGRGDHEVERPPPWLSPAVDNGCSQSSPFACDGCVDGEGIERCLDNTEPLGPPGPLVLRVGDEDAEMQLGKRRGADRAFELARAFCADEHGGVEEGSHLFGEEIRNLGGKRREIVVERLRGRRVPDSLQCRTVDPSAWACRPEAGDRTACDGNGELLACFGSPQHVADVVSELFLRNRGHDRRVALLLPGLGAVPGVAERANRLQTEHEQQGFVDGA